MSFSLSSIFIVVKRVVYKDGSNVKYPVQAFDDPIKAGEFVGTFENKITDSDVLRIEYAIQSIPFVQKVK